MAGTTNLLVQGDDKIIEQNCEACTGEVARSCGSENLCRRVGVRMVAIDTHPVPYQAEKAWVESINSSGVVRSSRGASVRGSRVEGSRQK